MTTTNNSGFISKYNFRPLILSSEEIERMRKSLDGAEGRLVFYPTLLKNKGVTGQVLTLRYILYKKEGDEKVENYGEFEPVRFDYMNVLGNVKKYSKKFANAVFPPIVIPHKASKEDDSISLSLLFEIQQADDWVFYLEQDECENIWLKNVKFLSANVGGKCVGKHCPES